MLYGTEFSQETNNFLFVIDPWHVILLNDDLHSFDEVIVQLIKATGCRPHTAADIVLEAHAHGESVCFTGTKKQCEQVGSVLKEVDLGFRLKRME